MVFYVIIRGPLGIGKSTIAESISKSLDGEHISVDRVVDSLEREKEEGYISQNNFKKANDLMVPKAKKLLDEGKPVIFDGNFYWKSQIEDLISKLDYEHFVFTLKAPLEVCIGRDKKRSKTHGRDAAEAVYRKSTSFSYGTVINTENKTKEEVIGRILEHILK